MLRVMGNKIGFRIIVALLACLTSQATVQAQESADNSANRPAEKKKKISLVPLPAIFYTPETRLGFGPLLLGTFKLSDDSLTRTSNGQILLAYTLNKQIISENTYNLFFPQEKYVANGEISFYDYPIFYYGVGNNTPDVEEENDFQKAQTEITYKLIYTQNRLLRKVRGPFFSGLQHRYTGLWDLEWKDQSRILDRPANELDGASTSGIGPVFLFDSRNSALNATKGFYAELSSLHHQEILGTEFTFSRYFLDLRNFIRTGESTVLAFQGLGNFSSGAVPFREMGLLGGQNMMRGYFRGRYRDKQYLAVQAEMRQHVWGPVGVVAFGAVGDVSDNLHNFDIWDSKYTVGAGLRVLVLPKDRVNIRIDYGIGKNTSGFYFGIAEAF